MRASHRPTPPSTTHRPWWAGEIEALLRTRADPETPRLQETHRLIELVFGVKLAPGDAPDAGLSPEERSAAIEYYVSRARVESY